jgi:2-polyprenyl-6-methoxyphenol hydroxylase-like FAD-dependent oxidoreductase
VRVVIIGSGIAGLTAAIALRKVGIDVVVYERAPELREVGAGISLWANALRALDYLGAGDAVRAVSLPLMRSELRANQGRRVLVSFAAKDFEQRVGFRPVVAMAHRAELVGALAGLLTRGSVYYGHECIGLEQHSDRVVAHFANGHTDEADCVVGADGIRSFVRKTLFGPQAPRYAGYTCWRGIAPRPEGIEPGYVGEWWGRGRRFGITTLTHDRVYWFAVQNIPPDRHAVDEKTVVAELFRGWAAPVPELIDATPSDRLIHGDIFDRPAIKQWSIGLVGLVGDAAHPTTPNLGQGGCMAIEDGSP